MSENQKANDFEGEEREVHCIDTFRLYYDEEDTAYNLKARDYKDPLCVLLL